MGGKREAIEVSYAWGGDKITCASVWAPHPDGNNYAEAHAGTAKAAMRSLRRTLAAMLKAVDAEIAKEKKR